MRTAVMLFLMALLVGCLIALTGCMHEPIRAPLVTAVKPIEVPVPLPTPCIKASDIPERPSTAMPDPQADIARKAAGASAEVRALDQYAKELRAALVACSKP